MSTVATSLKELHQLHLRLQGANEKLTRGPQAIRVKQVQVDRRKAEHDEKAEELKQLRMAADQKSLQLKTSEAKISDLKAKLNAAASNKEYEIIKSQIEADEMANSVLEDEILECYDAVDAMQQALAVAVESVTAAEAELKGTEAQVAEDEPSLQNDVEELENAITAAEEFLPTDVRADYRRLTQAHGADSLAPAINGICTACNHQMLPQMRVNLNSGKFVFCKVCGRLLYQDEP